MLQNLWEESSLKSSTWGHGTGINLDHKGPVVSWQGIHLLCTSSVNGGVCMKDNCCGPLLFLLLYCYVVI